MLESLLQKFVDKLAGKRVTPPLPFGRTVQIEHDDAEPVPASADQGELGLAYFIVYRAASGKVSQRRIACRRYEPAAGNVLAYCFERRAARRFKIERIESIVCVETGEVLDRDSVFAQLATGRLPVNDDRLAKIMTVLVFVMRCDREVHPSEAEVLDRVASAFALRFDGGDETVHQGLKLARSLAPAADDVARAIRWIDGHADRQRLSRLVLAYIDEVIAADGRVASEEAYFGGLLRDAFQAMAA